MDAAPICPVCGKPAVPGMLQGFCPECLMAAAFETRGGNDPAGGKPVFVPPSVEDIGKLFPQLEVVELLGRGGMGAVYKARQPRLDRFVALKILAPEKQSDPQFAERFEREARTLASLAHPNIVAIYDFGEALGHFYLMMEFVDGMTLRQLLQAGKLSPDEVLGIVPKICDALQFAHERGVIHRDIKPENILLNRQGQVKIADFGIAKILELGPGDLSLTGAQDVVGTPHYMAPEQVEKPQSVDSRADIFSLGVVFYEMLTGELPLGKFQPPSQKVQVDVRLDEVVHHSLEKEPKRRYQHASEVKTDVEEIAHTTAQLMEPLIPGQPIADGDYTLNIGQCLRQGWALVRSDCWSIIAITLLVFLVMQAVSLTGIGIIFAGPFMGGLWYYYLKKLRGEPAGVGTAFAGFKIAGGQLILATLVLGILISIGFVCLVLPGIYLAVAWTFTLPLIVDQRLGFGAAMKLSRRTISRHWWKFLGFILVLSLLNLAGGLLFFIGSLVTIPITLAALATAYEAIFYPARPAELAIISRQSQRSGLRWVAAAGATAVLAAIVAAVWWRVVESRNSNDTHPVVSPTTANAQAPGVSNGWESQLNHDQRLVLNWTEDRFGKYFDARTFDGWPQTERAELESRSLDTLKGPQSSEAQKDQYYQAINTLADLHSANALPVLRKIALLPRDRLMRTETSNRSRWMAVRALGVMGDKESVPALIHLLYYNNPNTHWWAQISLVRLTGQNFGKDWKAWGNWWNSQNNQPPFKPEIIQWSSAQAKPDELMDSMAQTDREFLDNIQGKNTPRIDDAFWLNLDRRNYQHYQEQLLKAPRVLVVRPTHYELNRMAATGLGTHYGWIDGRLANLSVTFSELVSYAFTKEAVWDPHFLARTEIPAKLAGMTNRFDVIDTLRVQRVERLQTEIKQQLKEQFGVAWHRETRDTEVLLVKVKSPELLESKISQVFANSRSLPQLTDEWENYFGKPVLDETGLTNRFDKDLDLIPAAYVPNRTKELEPNNAFLAQFGLELVPARQSIEWLILEPASSGQLPSADNKAPSEAEDPSTNQ